MITHGGEAVWPEGNPHGFPTDGYPSLHTIGVALGRITRFAGHLEEFYPVLAHVFVVAALLPAEIAVYGLMHDAAEACCGDVPTPWKTPEAVAKEEELLGRIYPANGLQWPVPLDVQAQVDVADYTAQCAEAFVIGHKSVETGYYKNPDARAMRLTEKQFEICRQYLDSPVSGPAFERYFEQVKPLADPRVLAPR